MKKDSSGKHEKRPADAGLKADPCEASTADKRIAQLATLARSFANLLALCAPEFPKGSNAAKIVALAANANAVIDGIAKGR